MPISIKSINVPKIRDWISNHGGVAVWHSINLSDPGREMLTPAKDQSGVDTARPHWGMSSKPAEIITSEKDVLVTVGVEFKRFHIAVRRSGNGLMLKLTDASSKKVRLHLDKAGDGSWYEFDYFTQDCVIYKVEKSIPLTDFKE